ncbi:MAG: hypothetical protein JST54_27210 [Deltaproteobacteria bacterium]|nr:hypothetical protein [Deltaproteobacteria bacterium]
MALEPWMQEVNAAGLARVADALALRIDGAILCTDCGCALESDFCAWRCVRCEARGDALTYAAQALRGRTDRLARTWQAVRDVLAARGLCRPAA